MPETATNWPNFGDSGGVPRIYTVSDGTHLHCLHFPASEPRAYVVALNGIQSHAGWYERSSTLLADAGFDVRLLDRRGSGRSGGLRGHAPHWERLVNDVVSVLKSVRWERGSARLGAPVVLMGISWGGKLAATVAAQRPEFIDGLALLYPGICSQIGPSLLQRVLLPVARVLGVKYRRAPIPLSDPALFTGEPAGQEFIRNDSLALHEATVGFFLADQELTRLSQQSGPAIQCPTLLMLAGRDRIADVAATRRWFGTVAAVEKRLVEFPEATHTLEFDPCVGEFVKELIRWLTELRSP
jgi:acylglycerol lipase